MNRPRRRPGALLCAAVVLGAAWAPLAADAGPAEAGGPLLIAPILGGAEYCAPAGGKPPPASAAAWAAYCREAGRSAATNFESTLAALGPPRSPGGDFEVGYTLPVPLLAMLRRSSKGWEVDVPAIERVAQTIAESTRPLVLYLFSTHFATGAPAEEALFGDRANVAVAQTGSMGRETYFGTPIYPWSVANTRNELTRLRAAVIDRLAEAVCRLPATDRRRIRAVTVLGELHHFHADFERGMSIGSPYVVSDYGEESVRGFRAFLKARFGSIEAMNRQLGERYASFADVVPPSRDVRGDKQPRRRDHLDSYAHGRVPLTGWAFDPQRRGEPVWIRILNDGRPVARVPARFGRQDVLQARPEIGNADVGWRYDLDFTRLASGEHRLDFLAELPGGRLALLGSRRIVVVRPDEAIVGGKSAPRGTPPAAGGGVQGHVDTPQDRLTVIYNPLAPLWHAFRGEQVVRYLAHFERRLRATCLGDLPLYTHQIAPFANPGWDATRFAAEPSLRRAGGLSLGISLYGEPIYGTSFFDWLDSTEHTRYGITEFHPLRAMSADELRATLGAHRRRGARFVAFFLDARPAGVRTDSPLDVFGIEPGNRHFGSDQLYESFRALLNE
jgi:hypothetical protein